MTANIFFNTSNIPFVPPFTMPAKPDTAVLDIITSISVISIPLFYYISMIGDVLLIIFLYNDFRKKNSLYRRPYYILLVIGYTIHFCDNILTNYIIAPFDARADLYFITILHYVRLTYFNAFFLLWNAALVLNKITALWLPLQHEKLWSRNFKKLLFFLLVTPLLTSLFIYADLKCTDSTYSRSVNGAADCDTRIRTTGFISTGVAFFLIGILIVLIFALHRKTVSTFSPQIAKVEKRLMIQALTSLILYGIFRTSELFSSRLCIFFGDCSLQFQLNHMIFIMTFTTVTKIIVQIPYLIDVVLLIVISKTFRTDFLNFYTFEWYHKFTHKNVSVASGRMFS